MGEEGRRAPHKGGHVLGLMKMAPGPGNVALGELPEPVPGPGEVVINVKAAGICGSDLHIRSGNMKYTLSYPVVMGHEYAGVVSALGEGVTDLPLGERVTSETLFSTCGVCLACRAGAYNQCAKKLVIGYYYHGCFASQIKIPRRLVHRLPDNVSFHEGAIVEPMACCVHAVTEMTSIKPGDVVVVAGPGSIGLVCAQLAKASGAYVICTGTRSDSYRLAMARQLGADQTINIEDESLADAVNRLTDGRGADAYVECSGHPAAARTGLTVTRRGGQYTQVGIFENEFTLDFAQIIYRELTVQGSVGSRRPSWLTALNLLASGQVKVAPLASSVYPLAQWEEAFRIAEDKSALKVLLVPEE
jgi:L-iditol 2-dehydrogenase